MLQVFVGDMMVRGLVKFSGEDRMQCVCSEMGWPSLTVAKCMCVLNYLICFMFK
jgi:hypothetical protein